MTQEDKKLLLKDLCARLPYGVKVTWNSKYPLTVTPYIYCAIISEDNINNLPKLLLRQMSSMTEEEWNEWHSYSCVVWDNEKDTHSYEERKTFSQSLKLDWLIEHHFDFRGLIDKGLALKAPKDMYK